MIEEEKEKEESLDQQFVEQLKKMSFEMKIVGFSLLIYGLVQTFTLFMAPIGILLIIAGKRVIDSASSLRDFSMSGSIVDLKQTFLFMRTYFRILFWLIIVVFCSFALLAYYFYYLFSPLLDMLQNTPIFS